MDAEKWIIEAERYRTALIKIQVRANSDAPCEELEDVQRDLGHIHAIATEALNH